MSATPDNSRKYGRPSRDAEVLTALKWSLSERGRMPTMKELCHDVSITRGQVVRNLARLCDKGLLNKLPTGTLLLSLPSDGDR